MGTAPKKKVIFVAVLIVILLFVFAGVWSWLQSRKTQALIEEGTAALNSRDWNTAAQKLALALERAPHNPDVVYGLVKANLELAVVDYHRGQLNYKSRLRQVENQLDSLSQLAPDRVEAYTAKGGVYFYLGRPEQARNAFEQALRRNAKDFQANLGLGKALYEISRKEPARAAEAIQSLQKAVQIRQNAQEAHRLLAELYLEQGKLNEAISEAEALQKVTNLSGESLKSLGKVRFYQGQYEAAKTALDQAKDKIKGAVNEREHVENRYLLGTTYFFLGNYEEARAHLKQARTSSKEEVYPLLAWSHLMTFLGYNEEAQEGRDARFKQAVGVLENAVKRDPRNPLAQYLLANAYLRQERFPDARDVLQRLVSAQPTNRVARFDLANLYHQLGDDVQAIRHYQEIIKQAPDFARAHYNLGTIFLSRAGYSEAVKYLEEADPNLLEAHLNLAQAYLGLNNFARAKQEYEKALELSSDDVQALNGLGMIYLREGDAAQAEELFKKAIRKAPDSDAGHALLAQMYLQQGNLTGAIRELETCVELNAQNYAAQIRLGNAYIETGQKRYSQKAIELFENLKENPSRSIVREALSGMALVYLAEGRFDEAKVQFNEILNLPNLSAAEQARIYVNIGNAYLKQDKPDLAREHYEKALAQDGTLAEAHYNLGRLYQMKGLYADARRKYMMAYSSDPQMAPAYYNLGVLYERRNDSENAEKQYQEALANDPTLAEGYLNLANLYQRQDKNEKALELLQQAKQLNPGSALVRDALSGLYYHQNEFDLAKAELNYPNPTAQALLMRGLLHYREGKYDEAVTQFQKARSMEGAHPRLATLTNLAAALIQIGNFPQAERQLNEALELQKDSIEVLNNLGALYIRTGRYDETEEKLNRSLALKSSQPDITAALEKIQALR